ncbi:hypothetical protein D3C81_673630 [compost metagenome]
MRLTRPANCWPRKASRVIRTAVPGRTRAASTSSIGASTYRQLSSIRSTAGGVGIPGGEGVTNSPSSPLISATMPANGARRVVCSSSERCNCRLASASRISTALALHISFAR